jgi:N-acetyl-gamma-glutamyl-phosphate reductase
MANGKIRAAVVGGAGYTGGEAIRLLLNHPSAELTFAQSRSQAGNFLYDLHPDLVGSTELKFTDRITSPVDVIFLCMSHGESKKLLTEQSFPAGTRLIDLGNDFRLGDAVNGVRFTYGLPEFQREAIRKSTHVANPGCFATAIQLGLLPLAKAGMLKEVYTTGITGSTGAGQKLQDATHFTWRANNVSAYKTLTHQHLGEIHQTLAALQPGFNAPVNFVPWRGDFTRGIFVTSIVESGLSIDDANVLYKTYYAGHPFTHVMAKMVDIKQVVNTNLCLIYLEKIGTKLAIHSVTDNLLKGASGQAVQNMNLMFGLNEDDGLRLKGTIF